MFNFQRLFCFLIIQLALSLFCPASCYSQQGVIKIDSTLDAPFFHQTVTDFPWYIIRTGKGKLENVLGNKLPKPADTTSLKKNVTSQVVRYDSLPDGVFMDNYSSIYTTAHLKGAELSIEFQYDPLPHEAVLELVLLSPLRASIHYGPPEKAKEESQIPAVHVESLVLNKKTYIKGDVLKGAITYTVDYILDDVRRGRYHQKVLYKDG
jgi:hypothetical protein